MHADKGVLKYLRWENARCAECKDERCLRTGKVYEGQDTFACATKGTEECTCAQTPNPQQCTNDAKEPFAYATIQRCCFFGWLLRPCSKLLLFLDFICSHLSCWAILSASLTYTRVSSRLDG